LNAGWQALGSGKSYHPKLPPQYDSKKSWSKASLPYENPCWNTADTNISFQDGGLPCFPCPIDLRKYLLNDVNVTVANEYCSVDAEEDTLTVDHAIKLLKEAVGKDQLFYLAVGLHKPHMPWQYDAEDLAKHPLSSITLPKHPHPPNGMPDLAFHFTDEKAPGHATPWTPLADADILNARRAYRASVTGMDRKLGKVRGKNGGIYASCSPSYICFRLCHGVSTIV
jgi:iduronate 2-sulfatase